MKNKTIKILFIAVLCFTIFGCACFGKKQLQETIKTKDLEIEALRKSVRERDEKIKTLKEKLSSFGAFE